MNNDKYLIDGATKQGPWAYMCVDCFREYGTFIKWGFGQLYQKINKNEWLLVAGYDKQRNETIDFWLQINLEYNFYMNTKNEILVNLILSNEKQSFNWLKKDTTTNEQIPWYSRTKASWMKTWVKLTLYIT